MHVEEGESTKKGVKESSQEKGTGQKKETSQEKGTSQQKENSQEKVVTAQENSDKAKVKKPTQSLTDKKATLLRARSDKEVIKVSYQN